MLQRGRKSKKYLSEFGGSCVFDHNLSGIVDTPWFLSSCTVRVATLINVTKYHSIDLSRLLCAINNARVLAS